MRSIPPFRVNVNSGYEDNYIQIDSFEDLEKAQYAFITDNKVIFSTGECCRGKDIRTIKEDWNALMGYNPSHVLDKYDWEDIDDKGASSKYSGLLSEAKQNVEELCEMNKQSLIGKSGTLTERLNLLT